MKLIPEHYEINVNDYKLLGELFIKEVGLERAMEILSYKQMLIIKGNEFTNFYNIDNSKTVVTKE